MKMVLNEWKIHAPWGQIALISWGNPNGDPVLLVHGREDSSATFCPLLKYLPDRYCYVALDFPGNGKSDPFPIGVQLTRHHFLVALDITIQQLKWEKFIYIAHSMGCELGLFYNAIYPHKITKFIFLDAVPSLQRLQVHDYKTYFSTFYDSYYSNYKKFTKDERVYSKRRALDAVMRARGMTEEQAELILSRNLIRIGEDSYKLSWDRRLKLPAPSNYPPDNYYKLFIENLPPSLLISASASSGYPAGKPHVDKIVSDMCYLKNFRQVRVEGTHDVHFTNPERIEKYVVSFLNNGTLTAKL